MPEHPRVAWNMDAYVRRVRAACYVCELLNGNPDYFHHVAYRDDVAMVYLCKYPSVWGHLLVAPIEHREHLVDDLDADEYVALNRVVHRAGRALTAVVETERLYLLSLGSQQGNRHLHLHLVPLPPGVPYNRQQLATMAEERGYLDLPFDEMALAASIGDRMTAGA
jgi:diadenosine tetraphosphate (Ap4A) HIT family hydrolase